MKVIHMVPFGQVPTLDDIHQAVGRFYHEHKMRPTVVKMSINDSSNFLKSIFNLPPVLTLEQGKRYANYVQTPTGPVLLSLLEDDEIVIQSGYNPNGSSNMASSSLIVVENKEIDEEFEKHVLNRDNE